MHLKLGFICNHGGLIFSSNPCVKWLTRTKNKIMICVNAKENYRKLKRFEEEQVLREDVKKTSKILKWFTISWPRPLRFSEMLVDPLQNKAFWPNWHLFYFDTCFSIFLRPFLESMKRFLIPQNNLYLYQMNLSIK